MFKLGNKIRMTPQEKTGFQALTDSSLVPTTVEQHDKMLAAAAADLEAASAKGATGEERVLNRMQAMVTKARMINQPDDVAEPLKRKKE